MEFPSRTCEPPRLTGEISVQLVENFDWVSAEQGTGRRVSRAFAISARSGKWVTKIVTQLILSTMCSRTAPAIACPSFVLVPLPSSSKITSERGVASLRMSDVSLQKGEGIQIHGQGL